MTDNDMTLEDVGMDLYKLKRDLENTLHVISTRYYKDQRGDIIITTDPNEIESVGKELDILIGKITYVKAKIIQANLLQD